MSLRSKSRFARSFRGACSDKPHKIVRLEQMSYAAIVVLVCAAGYSSAAEQMNNGERTRQTEGGSAEVQGDANLGRNSVNRTEDIQRTSTGELRIGEQQLNDIRNSAAKAKLVRSDPAFTISVGAAVPKQADTRELPVEIARLLNTTSPLEYVLARDQLIIIDQLTRRIIAILPGVS
jgi:hypothetical protein